MRKIIFVFLIFIGFAQARFFVGLEGGWSYSVSQGESEIFDKTAQYLQGGYLGVNFGTEHYFARDSLLFRWFLGAGGDIGIAYGDLNLGIDFMGMLHKSDTSAFGLFVGVEMSTVLKDWVSGFGGALRLGMSTLVGSNHRIELYWRKRLGEFSEIQNDFVDGHMQIITTYYKQNDTVMLAYKRLF